MRSSPWAKSFALFAYALSLITMTFLFSVPVMAQATTGTIKGTVVDPNGAVIAGASVTVKNEATGVEEVTTTSGEGNFTVPNLLPGKYTVTVAPPSGFSTKAVTGVDVRVATDTDIKIDLAVGSPSETVTVTGNTEEIVQTNSQISASFETRKVEELPSNAAGGGIDTLALLAPGVVPGFGNVNSNGTTLSVNGNRARANNFTLDGTDNNDLSIGGPNFFISNQDSVQEFQVITNNYSAQFGRNQGAVINIVTKSGTNEFHGSVFEFHRNSSALDAMTNQQRADPGRDRRDKFVSNVFGGTLGGPIIRNKVFFFFDTQFIRQREQFAFAAGNRQITREGLATLAANFPGNPAIAALVNQGVATLQPTARPQANTTIASLCFPRDPLLPCTGANAVVVPTAFHEYDLPLPFNQKEFGIRGDFSPTSRDSFNVKYRYQESPETGFLGQSNGFFGDIPFKSRNFNGAYTRQLTPHLVNEFKAAWQKLSVIFGGCSGESDPLKGCIPHADEIGNAFTNITFTGISSAGNTMQSLGPATNLPQGREVRVAQFADSLAWTTGQHSIVFGADIRDLANTVPFLPNLNGAFRFGAPPVRPCAQTDPPTCSPFASTARIVANAPSFVTLGAGEPAISYKERDQFYFVQDDWKVRDNLTLNLGVRYEYTGQPINTLHELSLARENDPAQALWRQSLPIEARTFPKIPADKNNWAPRLGFAWSPRLGDGGFSRFLFGENDATVIRGGFSIAYEPAFYNILLNVSTSAPLVFLNTINNSCTTSPCGATTDAGAINLLTSPTFGLPSNPTGDVVRSALGSFLQRDTFDPRWLTQTDVGSDFHSPYSKQWSFGIQRQVNRNNVAEIRYVGNSGVDLFQTVNANPDIRNLVNGFTLFGETFPGFPQLTNGVTPLVCVNNSATPDNEGACNGRIVPGRGLIRRRQNTGSSSYHALQTRYNGRLSNQLTLGASYTFSKTMDNASEIFAFGENAIASNPFDLTENERGLSGNDRRHAFSLNFLEDIPFYKDQKGFVGHLLGGWQVNGTYVLASGRPFTPSQFFNSLGLPTYQDFLFGATFFGFDNVRPFTGNPNAPRDSVGISDVDAFIFFSESFVPSPTGFYNLAALNNSCQPDGTGCNFVPVTTSDVRFILNAPGAARFFGNPFGNVARNSERGPALNHLNLGIFKNTRVSESVRIQFRLEMFNALNHPNPGYGVAGEDTLPDTFVEDAGIIGSRFNDKRDMTLSSRRIQLGIRIIF
ncbi:MAG TPA: carboxypeptidase regulatory-like domain-containing protein [Pyrinomonadaceae bacterium]|nr:carboxypeptidase regulatory-like domain-containing protein [Pyrinomonadaceae bacterium]